MPGRGSTVRLGRLAGIPIGIHPLWLVVVWLITFSLGHDYFPNAAPGIGSTAAYTLGLAGALGLFAGILLHELGHAIVARRHGVEVEEIDLWLLGGVARLGGEASEPDSELRFAAAGPLVTAVIAAVLGLARLAAGGALPDWGRALLDYEIYVNVAILGLNLLPAFPLDGGRIFRSLMWRRTGDRDRATAAAAGAGRTFGWVLVAVGALSFFSGAPGGLWFALIGGFLIVAAGAEAQSSRLAHALAGRTAGQLMSSPAVTLDGSLTVAEAVPAGFSHHLFSAFPVVDDDGRAIGLITLDDVRGIAPARRAATRLADAAQRDPALLVAPDAPVAEIVAGPAFQRVGRAVVAGRDGQALGLLSITDVQRRLRVEELLADPRDLRRAA